MTVTRTDPGRKQGPAKPANDAPSDGVQFGSSELWRPTGQTRPAGPHQWLLENHLVTPQQIDKAVAFQKSNPNATLLQSLLRLKAIDQATAYKAVAGYFNLPFVSLTSAEVDPDVVTLLPPEFLKAKRIMPMAREADDIRVALSDPADIFLIDDIKRRLGRRLRLSVATPDAIAHVIDELSANPTQQVEDIIRDIAEDTVEVVDEEDTEAADLEKIAGESPVIRYVNYLISSAVRDGASDIHIEPGEKRLKMRCRIDGMLFEQQAPPLSMHAAVISRLKIMANLNIAERRLPQDGRIRAMIHGRSIDLRVSTLPTTHGEKCVIRILDNRSITIGLDNLGMGPETLKMFREQVSRPHGIVLVTGPTGSGKSTTLYSALQIMDSERQNISTVEDPVEYELASVNQVNVHDQIGMSFSAALRSLLRQDPDIIMLGEIRDAETARIAVQASLTGHLVLSTLHTNDAPSSVTRLINIGVEPYLISAALNAVLAQRLVRRICDHCKQPVTELRAAEQAYLKACGKGDMPSFRGAGCDRCRQTGFKGRVGLYELMVMDDHMRDVVTSSPSLGDLRKAADATGMPTLRTDGLAKATDGQTTIDEIMRITEVA